MLRMHGRMCDFKISDQTPAVPFLVASAGGAWDHDLSVHLHEQVQSQRMGQ